MSIEQTTINLGDEYDNALRDALRAVLLNNKAMGVDTSWGIGGSQEIAMSKVRLGDGLITIESETYIGLTISGPKQIVEKLAEEVRKELNPSSD
ncbi:hypothetical protein FNU76_10125 [Chitinimonas arctica]|uniref:Polyhydroxyalkanoic acid system protein n=1 Tax=Chitinimonas arctica TaxID=2594795 RepID=A0A516SEZ8_9NEIS|nr:hypothetical protein [Chitinimonas arctica]QDQ26690.1 hypothetical protein FNU76_10125 [Chitinimonas arctica]